MGQIILKRESLVTLKRNLETSKNELNTSFTNINTNFEAIKKNWKGKRATDTLNKIEELKNNNTKLLTKLQEKIDYIESVIQTIDKVESAEVKESDTSKEVEKPKE